MTAYLRAVAILLALANLALIIWPLPALQEIVLMATIGLFILHCSQVGTRWLNPFFLFSLTATMFLAGRFLGAQIVDYLDYNRADWFIYGLIEPDELSIALGAIGLFLSGVMLPLPRFSPLAVDRNEGFRRYSTALAIVLLPFFLYRALENLRIYQAGSYLDLYLGSSPGGPLYNLGGWFIIAVFAVLASRPRLIYILVFFMLGMAFCVFESITGARGIPLAYLIMLCWLAVTTLRIRVPFWGFAASLVVLVLFADFLGRSRVGLATDFDPLLISRSVVNFLYSQGTTLLFMVGVTENLDKFSWIDALGSTFALFMDMARALFPWHDADSMRIFGVETLSLSHRVASLTNPKMYDAGMGIGGSAVGEAMLYSIYVGPWIAGVFTGCIMRWLYAIAHRGAPGLFFFSYTFSFLLLVPRETQLYFIVPAIKALIFLAAFWLLKKVDDKLRHRRLPKRHGDRADVSPGTPA
ncbi:Uncharacterised protein [Bordetella ansorpii]|uniref:O-antigen polysaccharide polymerase Wzy n=1 Tax=Bordetella ansorpii TaxID=288768 RepID=A0A157R1G0_9BORD|nr:O-antigen polysaccharide polymerase Wzy [Bordetella ansorpii]SAI51790.1 Uncharacterised protein [Bordetella ansorpii]